MFHIIDEEMDREFLEKLISNSSHRVLTDVTPPSKREPKINLRQLVLIDA